MPDPLPVTLLPLDRGNLEDLLAAAVDGAEPSEVMAPLPGEPGWTVAQRAAAALRDGVAIVAETTRSNPAAVRLLRGLGASTEADGERVHARLPGPHAHSDDHGAPGRGEAGQRTRPTD